ncbi:sporulation protein YqfD [Paenalkalicoccus suaedae]|uniref:Sporulation protein YqfD n=1 Tax=Paenalkalicoccus suaedae TaxID=2592382 RepID=A0A859FDC6_9BACI|nr:sporulation protein YqfD [Paenalkalicoccus suaedae]QKS70858.1 sporulation protein YqfD [Paenalkalicoccus suaedae]
MISLYKKVYVEQINTAAFVRLCQHHRIRITVVKTSGTAITCHVHIRDIDHLMELLTDQGANARIHGYVGMMHSLSQLNIFALLGSVGFALTLYILMSLTWSVEVEGGNVALRHQVLELLEEKGLKQHSFIVRHPSMEELQTFALAELDQIAFIGGEKIGTTYSFRIIEKRQENQVEEKRLGHLTATRDAVIKRIVAGTGTAAVRVDQFVRKNDILISGYIGREEDKQLVAAEGEVIGEFWEIAKVEQPLIHDYETVVGPKNTRYAIQLGSYTIPLFFNEPGGYKERQSKKLLDKGLTIAFHTNHYYELTKTQVEYAQEEAVQEAKSAAKDQLQETLTDSGEILQEKVLHESMENGKVKVVIHYTVNDSIAKKRSVIKENETIGR